MMKRAAEAPDYLVDEDRGALINTNIRALDAYRKQRASGNRVVDLEKKVDLLTRELNEMRELVATLVRKNDQ